MCDSELMTLAEMLDALDALGRGDEAEDYAVICICEGAFRGIQPDDVLGMGVDAVAEMMRSHIQLPGWDLTVWGPGFAVHEVGVDGVHG